LSSRGWARDGWVRLRNGWMGGFKEWVDEWVRDGWFMKLMK
jgi:hypothetical protein